MVNSIKSKVNRQPSPVLISIPYHQDGEPLFARFYDLPYSCWLDSGKPGSHYGRYDIISALPSWRLLTPASSPQTEIYRLHHPKLDHPGTQLSLADYSLSEQSDTDPIALLQEQLQEITAATPHKELPFSAGAIGYFGYDLVRRYRHLNTAKAQTSAHPFKQRQFADMQVGLYQWAIIQDHKQQQAWLTHQPDCPVAIIAMVKQRLEKSFKPQQPTALQAEPLRSSINREYYLRQLDTINDYILAGDTYQVNFAQCFQARYTGEPYSAYRNLRNAMASPFSAYLRLGKQAILSLSPERFLRTQAKQITTQPIKGTAPRSTDKVEDQQIATALVADEKNRAENLMIVDLLRNDLGQHCVPGSIEVEKLFHLQSFPNVHHLVSTVSGQLAKNSSSLDLLRDAFPGGSITGAPKKRSMEIIDELENDYREIYCGSIGYINHNGDMDTNIAIRTVSFDGEQLSCWGGGGIVADSKPEEEYQESLNKINRILNILSAAPQ